MKTSELTGALLDYWVARAEGYVWARNTCKRSGDSYRQRGEPEQWPIGARFMVKPSRANDLDATKPNWDGWVIADGTEPIGPRWNYGLPKYSTDWAQGGPIIEREVIDLSFSPQYGYVTASIFRHPNDQDVDLVGQAEGYTPLVAAMRAYVASKFGDEVQDVEGVA